MDRLFMVFQKQAKCIIKFICSYPLFATEAFSSFYGFHVYIDGQQGQLLAAFRAFPIITLKDFVRRLKLRAFV